MSAVTSQSRRQWSDASCLGVQVIFLDSDNVAVADPAALFDSAAYVDKGAVLWPDYWASSAAPDLQRILPTVTIPANTFESGQMVLNKRRCVDLPATRHNCRCCCTGLLCILCIETDCVVPESDCSAVFPSQVITDSRLLRSWFPVTCMSTSQ